MRRLAVLVLLVIVGCGSDDPGPCADGRCSTLAVSRDGSGTITAEGAGIDCGAACVASVPLAASRRARSRSTRTRRLLAAISRQQARAGESAQLGDELSDAAMLALPPDREEERL